MSDYFVTLCITELKIFPWAQSNLNLKITGKLNFNDFFITSGVKNILNIKETSEIRVNNPVHFFI